MPINDGAGGNLADTFGGSFGTTGGNPSTTGGSPTNPGGWGGGGYPGGYSGNWRGASGGMGFGGTPPGYGPSMPYPGGFATPYLQSPLAPPAPPAPPVGPYPGTPFGGTIDPVAPDVTLSSLLGMDLGPAQPPATIGPLGGPPAPTGPTWQGIGPTDNPPVYNPPNGQVPGTDRPWSDVTGGVLGQPNVGGFFNNTPSSLGTRPPGSPPSWAGGWWN